MINERLFELNEITLVPPTSLTSLYPSDAVYSMSLFVVDPIDVIAISSYPVFTSPMSSIVTDKNYGEVWMKNLIRPIIPRDIPLDIRIELCQKIFCAFGPDEIWKEFMEKKRQGGSNQYRICIDAGNGHGGKELEMGNNLKKLYGDQIILMGGNIGNPQSYYHYSLAQFDYVRAGIASGSIVNKNFYGYHYPMASLLSGIKEMKKQCQTKNMKPVKVIADGGIQNYSDILKCYALGADYVMIGREFAKCKEAAGDVYEKVIENKRERLKRIEDPVQIFANPKLPDNWYRHYSGNTSLGTQALRAGYANISEWTKAGHKSKISDSRSEWVRIDKTLESWILGLDSALRTGLSMSGCKNISEFAEKAVIHRLV